MKQKIQNGAITQCPSVMITQMSEKAQHLSQNMDNDLFRIKGVWNIDLLFNPNKNERKFEYKLLVVQTTAQGCCYYSGVNFEASADLLGLDARTIESSNNPFFKIALLDSIYSNFSLLAPVSEFIIHGTSEEKAVQRTDIVVKEVLHQLSFIQKAKKTVLNIGTVGLFIEHLKHKNINVLTTDLDTSIVGKNINGTIVYDGLKHNLDFIKNSDVILVTGMTIASNTLQEILYHAKLHGKKVVIFAETGAWFAQEYCLTYGVDAVISEPFPFYIFNGYSEIKVYRSSHPSV